uniref:Uncharacterized protein n=1 Tax=Anguilla anguilla TaxID=7936 RepID=A0A0E9QWK8_ANGAN
MLLRRIRRSFSPSRPTAAASNIHPSTHTYKNRENGEKTLITRSFQPLSHIVSFH